MPFADVPGLHLWYEDSGGGPPLVLLHAASGTSASWAQQVAAFTQAGYRCLAYDRRGWGRTEVLPGNASDSAASDDLQALAEHLQLPPFHLVATAAGAAVAVDYALSYPGRARSLVLADGTAGVRDPEYLALLERIRPPEFQALPTYLRELSASYRARDPEGTRRWCEIEEHSKHPDAPTQKPRNTITFARLETLRLPVLVLVGEADASTPPPVLRQVASHLPDSTFTSFREAGHASFWEQPEAWNATVLGFLGSQAQPAP